jgi:archaellum component FlaC
MFVEDDFDNIYNQILQNSSELTDLVLQAKDLTFNYELLKTDIIDICSNPHDVDLKILHLREKFYILIKTLNQINKQISKLIFQST